MYLSAHTYKFSEFTLVMLRKQESQIKKEDCAHFKPIEFWILNIRLLVYSDLYKNCVEKHIFWYSCSERNEKREESIFAMVLTEWMNNKILGAKNCLLSANGVHVHNSWTYACILYVCMV